MELWIILIFCIGYLCITLEHTLDINKTATALVTGVALWTIYTLSTDYHHAVEQLLEQLGEISSILFFLMGAMTIVELIDAQDGFDLINSKITSRNRRRLLWLLSTLTFFLSAILDNLTTTIVMATLVIKMVKNVKMRLLFISMIVIAANAGGAWSPIGDITTTMLWIGGQISTLTIVGKLIVPSLVSFLVPLGVMTFMVNGDLETSEIGSARDSDVSATLFEQRVVFFAGLGALVGVPAFKTITHLPPFMGMLLGLGLLWLLTEILHRRKAQQHKQRLSVISALEHMDVPSVLFFLGILLAVCVLQNAGQLIGLSQWLTATFKQEELILGIIGMLSAIVDNVPLVAATMGMYSLDVYPIDSSFWVLLAYCAGTGGSMLIIGSAAGVAAMGLEKIPFGWYLKNISWIALLGYLAGILAFIVQEYLVSLF